MTRSARPHVEGPTVAPPPPKSEVKWSAILAAVGVPPKNRSPRLAGASVHGASRIRTADLLGAIQAVTPDGSFLKSNDFQRLCGSAAWSGQTPDANGYAPICRVSATSGEKWLKSLGPGWTGAWGRSLGAAAPEIVRQRLAGGEHTRRPGSSTRLDAGPHAILARPGGRLGLGAQAGEERLRAVAEEAEFTPVPPSGLPRRPSTLHLEARP